MRSVLGGPAARRVWAQSGGVAGVRGAPLVWVGDARDKLGMLAAPFCRGYGRCHHSPLTAINGDARLCLQSRIDLTIVIRSTFEEGLGEEINHEPRTDQPRTRGV